MLLRPRNLVGLTPLLLLTAAGWAAVLNVPAQYATIQAAIGAAQNNDEIVVAPGTYAENINFGGKTLNVHSSGGAAVTTIDGRNLGSAVAINNNEPAGTACTGFTITRGGMFLGNGTHATVRDCIFRDNTGSNGPALIMEYANALVRDCTFRDNIGDGEAGALRAWGNCQPTLRHCTFLNNRAHPTVGEGNAGAVRLDDAGLRITLEDCLFQGNSAGWAGVLDIRNRNAAVLRRCRFVGNTARVSAGAVAGYNQCRPTFEDCEFLANSVQQDWGGAATFGDGSRPTMLRCRFEANTASTGGAIVAYDATTLATVTDSVFTGNTAEWEGGALLVQWSATLVLSACRLEGNSAMWGGALHCHAAATLSLRDSVLRGNSARDGGGAILVHDWGTATLTATDFSDNTAQNNGGAVWVGDSNTNTQISACYFARNTTSGGGGAVHGRDGAPLDIQDSTFAANSAWTGGAVYVCCNGILTLAGAYFADNYAADTGGALYADGQYSQIQVRDADFVNNGSWMGGAVQFSGLTEPLLQNCFLVANSATGVGGAVRSESCTNLRLLGCVLVANRAGDLGGGIAFWGGTQTAQIANCTIADNQAVVSSGGLANGNSANVIALSNCILDGNVVGTSPSQIGGDPVSATYSLIRGGYGGLGNIDADPAFADRAAGDYRLTDNSPCLDQGNNIVLPPALTTDNEGLFRIIDGDGNGAPVVDLGAYEYGNLSVLNITTDIRYDTLADALAGASLGDEIRATPLIYRLTPGLDPGLKAVTLSSTRELVMSSGAVTLPNDTRLSAAAGYPVIIGGSLQNRTGDQADVTGGAFTLLSGADLYVRQDSELSLTVSGEIDLQGATQVASRATLNLAGATRNGGDFTLLPGATCLADNAFTNDGELLGFAATFQLPQCTNNASLRLSDVTWSGTGLTNTAGAELLAYGEFYTDLTNNGTVTLTDTTLIVGDLQNNVGGLIKVQIGTTTLIGQLTNDGAIVGDFQQADKALHGTQPGDGLTLDGDYVAGPASSLLMAQPVWRLTVAGHFASAVDSHTRFDMAQAELRLTGTGGTQTLEAMSTDIGRALSGLDRTLPGHYPLGTLHIGPGAAVVQVVDQYDNDGLGQTACEAIYADQVQIDAGTTLMNPTCKVYYRTLTNQGTVTHPQNLLPLAPPLCRGDGNCDMRINWRDIDYLVAAQNDNLAAWTALFPGGSPACQFLNLDTSGDGHVNWRDIDPFIALMNTSCP